MLHHVGQSFGCSNCRNLLVFKTEQANTLICPDCQTLHNRLELSGTVGLNAGKVREDMSIIRLGVTGVFRGMAFEVIGRIQYFFQDSYRNHWLIIYSNNETAWLGDWAGNYSIFQEVHGLAAEEFRQTEPGSVFQLQQNHYEVEMLDEHRLTFAEGEISGYKPDEKNFITLYLTDISGPMMLVNIFQKKQAEKGNGIYKNALEVFTGVYLPLEALNLQNLRQHDEWR